MYTEDLFDDQQLSKKSSFDENTGERGQDGLYRIDLNKVSPDNKGRGYRAKLRFLPNFTNNPDYVKAYAGDKWNEDLEVAMGPSNYQKISHYLNIQQDSMSHLKGFYDDPTNINPKTQKPYTNEKWGPFATTYFNLKKSENALAVEKSKMIKYNNKYFSYILVMEDEQQPELVGKIMILSYGKQIKDIIESEKNGEATGLPCEIFSLKNGKDFVILAKENTFTNTEGKEVTAPDYTKSRFYESTSTVSLPKQTEDGKITFINVPMEDDKVKPEHQEKIVEFLLSREVELEAFAGQEWDEKTQEKVTEAIDYLTGKTSSNNSSKDTSKVDDFSFDDASSESNSDDDDDDTDLSDIKDNKDEFSDLGF
jgi:hypothetical protein